MVQQPSVDDDKPTVTAGIRAAEYVRMSTDHQRYSTGNQSDAIRDYAKRRRIEIVRTYADHGKSGLSIAGRDALKRLLDDVRFRVAGMSPRQPVTWRWLQQTRATWGFPTTSSALRRGSA